jgi:hypothetical protein
MFSMPKSFDEFKETFRCEDGVIRGTSTLKPDGVEPIKIRGYSRGGGVDYPNPGIHKWRVNYGRVFKNYRSFENAMKGVFKDLMDIRIKKEEM